MITKASLRQKYLLMRKNYPNKQSDSEIICDKLRDALKPFTKIALYYPIRGEVNIWPLVIELSGQKEVYLPIVSEELRFKRFTKEEDLVIGKMGIKEPQGQSLSSIHQLEAVVIPSIAINKNGFRLGFGKGFYDKALREYQGQKIGVIYSFQYLDVDFKEEHDMMFNLVITEKDNERIGF